MAWTKWFTHWGFWVLIVVSLVACGTSDSPTTQNTPGPDSPTTTASPARATSPTTISQTPFTSSPTFTPETATSAMEKPAPSPTSVPQAEVVLVLLDCLRMFCVPDEMENRVMRVDGKPGILLAEMISEFHARLVYDPAQLSEGEAVQIFIDATNMDARIDR